MICPACQGTGRHVVHGPRDGRRHGVRPVSIIPCPDCGGCGFTHCCEGEQAQPAPEAAGDGCPAHG